jgi:hypothetical protein
MHANAFAVADGGRRKEEVSPSISSFLLLSAFTTSSLLSLKKLVDIMRIERMHLFQGCQSTD